MAERGGPMDRGWNDPPMFHCEMGSDTSAAPPKLKLQLNKRVGDPSMIAPKSENTSVPAKNNQLSEIASSPPRLHPFLKGGSSKAPLTVEVPITRPIPTFSSSSSPSSSASSSSTTPTTITSPKAQPSSSQLTSREKRVKVIDFFRSLIDNLRQKRQLPEKQSSDVLKKIETLERQWLGNAPDADPPLSADAQDKLRMMVEAAEATNWDQALKIQVALAVDHAGAVKKWAMAVKKLLLIAQSHASTEENKSTEQQTSSPHYFLPSNPQSSE